MSERKSLNKIVVDYHGEEKLVLLAVRNTDTGRETPGVLDSAREWGFDVIDEINSTLDELKNEIKRDDFINKEGFVVVYENGFRVKMKYAEYFRLHKIICNVNEKFVWEFMSQGKPLEITNIPDETFQFIKDTQKSLYDAFEAKWKEADTLYREIHLLLNQKYGIDNWEKKDFALMVIPVHKKLSGILFKLYENQVEEAKKLVWKMIEPKYQRSISGFQSMKMGV
jgi:RNA ligase